MAKSKYWDRQFAYFDGNKGQFVPTWSWWALLFNLFWYARKGMWVKLLVIFWVEVLLGALLPPDHQGSFFMLLFLYPPLFAKWDYYLLRKRGKHLW